MGQSINNAKNSVLFRFLQLVEPRRKHNFNEPPRVIQFLHTNEITLCEHDLHRAISKTCIFVKRPQD